MKHRKKSVWLMVLLFTALIGTTVVGADDPKKPAAVAASTSSAHSSKDPANSKPAVVQASSGKKQPSVATHIEVVDASVKLEKRYDSKGKEYKAATEISDVHLVVKGHGIQTDFAGSSQKGPKDPVNYDGQTAFQILVEQGFFEFKDGVGFIPTEKYAQMRDISSGSTTNQGGVTQGGNSQGGNSNQGKGNSILGSGDDLILTPDKEEKLVDPPKSESVVEEPSSLGAVDSLFGQTVDGDWETYNPDDPNTPEGKKKLLSTQLSELSGLCWETPEAKGYLSCNDGCTNMLWSEYGKVSQDKVDKCRRDCKAAFEQSKPQVCRDADSVEAQLDQLGDD